LIDGGATHNFIDAALVTRRQIPTEEFEGFEVVVANGYNMTCTQRIRGLEVTLGNYTLTNDFYVVDLADTNVVLGVQWLYSLSDFKMNYQEMRMEFIDARGHRVILRGISSGAPKFVANRSMEALFRHEDVACATEYLVTMQKPSQDRQHYSTDIQLLLGKHDKVFGPFTVGIPPYRVFEHVIELEEGAKPVITTPYRHPNKFKDEIENAIQEILEMGYIRPTSSPFSSSVVLVKKKDSAWRMCIDYRALNKKTVKKRYMLPKIDELIDDLHGAVYFLNIDLQSGYHQIRVRE
jgi:hypothetical protein